jgi:hypothetical protein
MNEEGFHRPTGLGSGNAVECNVPAFILWLRAPYPTHTIAEFNPIEVKPIFAASCLQCLDGIYIANRQKE